MVAVMKRLLIKDNILLGNICWTFLSGGITAYFWQSQEYGMSVVYAFFFGSTLTTAIFHLASRYRTRMLRESKMLDDKLIHEQHKLIVQQDLLIKALKEQVNDKG